MPIFDPNIFDPNIFDTGALPPTPEVGVYRRRKRKAPPTLAPKVAVTQPIPVKPLQLPPKHEYPKKRYDLSDRAWRNAMILLFGWLFEEEEED